MVFFEGYGKILTMTKFDNLWHVTRIEDRDVAIGLYVAINVPGVSGAEYRINVQSHWHREGVTVLVNFIHNFTWTKQMYEDLCFTNVLDQKTVNLYRHFFNGVQKFENLAYGPKP